MDVFNKIVKYFENKIPLIPLILYFSLVKLLFSSCPNKEYQGLFIGLYVFYCCLVAVWAGFIGWCNSKNKYPNDKNIQIIYSTITAIIASLAFFSFTYYLEAQPFICFFEYNKLVAGTIFFIVIGLVLCVSIIEHYFFDKLVPDPNSILSLNNDSFENP